MTPIFLTNQEAQKRIAELEALAKGASNSASVRDIDSDEALVAHMKAARLKREAAPSAAAVKTAVQARLDAGRAALAAAEAKVTARKAAAAIAPGLTSARQFAGEPLLMAREEFRKLNPADRARFVREGGKLV